MTMLSWVLVSVALGVLNFAALILIYKKLRSVHLKTFELQELDRKLKENELINHFQQGQVVRILEHETALNVPLPPMRGWAASPDFLLVIFRHAIKHKPEVIVECSSGNSTLILARAAELNGSGHIYSLEHQPVFAEKTRQELVRCGLSHRATILDAPLVHQEFQGKDWLWYDVSDLPDVGIDLIVVDGPPLTTGDLARYPAGPALFPRLNAGGALFLDDAAREPETEITRLWAAEFPDLESSMEYCEKGCSVFSRPKTDNVPLAGG